MTPLLMVLLVAGSSADLLKVVSSTRDRTVVHIDVPEPTWETSTSGGRAYRVPRLAGGFPRGVPGEPDLPVMRFVVAVPPGTRPSVEVTTSDRVSYRGVDLPPAAREALLPVAGRGMEPVIVQVPPSLVSEPYPQVRARVVQTGRIRSLDVAYVEVCPFQYYPSQRLLCLDRDLTVTVTTPPAPHAIARRAVSHDFMEPVLRRLVLNWEEASAWREGPPVTATREIARWDPPSPALKLLVDHEGFYSVTGEELAAAGMPIWAVDPASLRLVCRGVDVPFHVIGDADGRLDPSDRLEFLGEPVYREDQGHRLGMVGGVFAETNVYWLTWGGTPGVRMQRRTVGTQGGVRPLFFRERAHIERDLNPFVPNVAAISGDRYGTEWFWGPPLTPADGMVSYSFTLRGVANVSNGIHQRVSLRGYTHPDLMQNPHHHAIVYLNNVQLTHLLWYANDEAFYDSRFDPYYVPSQWPNGTALREGQNEFAVQLSGDTEYGWMDGAYTDWFELDYWRTYEAWNDSLAFWSPQHLGPGTYQYVVSRFTFSGQVLIDVTHRQILEGYEELYQGVLGGWTVRFTDATADSTRYLALASSRKESVLGIVAERPSNLHDAPGAEFVIITHEDLLPEASRLAVERTFGDTPLSTMVVDVQDVYDEYAFGVFDPRAIRDFLVDAYVTWPVPPSFVLLFGDASWDYKLNSPTSDPSHRNFVPSMANPVLDDYFANVDDQGGADSLLPDLYLSRIAVENADTARTVVDKLLGYASRDWAEGPWRENVLLIAGGYRRSNGADDRGIFKSQCQTLINQWVLPEPAHYRAILFARPESLHFDNEFETTEDESLQHYFNEVGVAHATYLGHGASWTWETMFWADDVENDLTNTRMLPMVNSLTCHTGRFANPEIDSFGEIWMWQPHGAMGFWGTTGWGYTTADYYLASRQFESIFRYQERTPIVALTYAKLAPEMYRWWNDPMISPLLYTWLGDPLIRLGLAERPDWAIDSMWVEPQPVISGDTIRVCVRVRNKGIDPGPPTTLRLFDADPDSGGTALTELGVPPLGKDGSSTVMWEEVASGAAGVRFVFGWVNPDTAQQEAYRGDNRGSTSYLVSDPIPDLATADSLLTITPSSPQVLDSVLTMTLQVANIGTGPAGAFRVLFRDSSLTDAVVQELADVAVAGVARGATTTVSARWAFTDVDAGDHEIKVLVDSRDEVVELDETNNVAKAFVHIATRAELVAHSLEASNDRPPEGDPVFLTGVWYNAGESPTPPYDVAIFRGHPDSATSSLLVLGARPSLSGGTWDSLTVAWETLGNVGPHTFYLVVDRGGTVPELDEGNNVRALTLEVASGTDLRIVDFSMVPPAPIEGDSARVLFSVRNGGMIPADSFTVRLRLDGATIREWRVEADARASQVFAHAWQWARGASAGDHVIEVIVDVFDEVAETNEDNNTLTWPVHVMALADVAVILTPSAVSLVEGDRLTLTTMVRNLGEASAHTVRVGWEWSRDEGWVPLDSLVIPTLDGGEHCTAATSLIVHPGTHTFRTWARAPVEEQRLDNNEAYCTVMVRELTPPDLFLTGVVLLADTVKVGDRATVEVRVGNAGEAAPESAWVELRPLQGDSVVVSSPLQPPPAPGATSSVLLSWVPPHGPSSWRIVASCLPQDAVMGNEADTVRVTTVWPADLTPLGGLVLEPSRPLTGDTLQAILRVCNVGERPAPLYTVALFRGNPSPGQPGVARLLATVTPGRLDPGDSTTVVLTWVVPDEPGLLDLYAWIDAAQLVPERNEADNLVSSTVEILSREFVVDRVLPVPSPAPGKTSFLVRASHEAHVEIRLYTLSGRLVQVLGPVYTPPARHVAIPWECDDRDGHRVANGVYLYRAELRSERTGEEARFEGKVTVVR